MITNVISRELKSGKSRKRVNLLIVGAILQLCVGIYYIWGIFQEPVMRHLNWTSGEASATFYIMIISNVIGNIFGGRIYDRMGPRITIYLGGTLFSGGIFLSSLIPLDSPWMIYLTYGIMAGIGSGIVYMTNVSTSQKWWMDKNGLAGGIIVTAFGASTMIFAPIVNNLLAGSGLNWTFRILAVFYAITFGVLGVFVQDPPEGYEDDLRKDYPGMLNQKQYTAREVIHSRKYYILIVSLMLLPPTYYILNPLFKTLGQARGLSESLAVGGIMLTGIASATGRMVSAKISDFFGAKKVLKILYLIMLISLIGGIFAQGIGFILVIFFVAFAYGGCAGITPVLTANFFGTKNIGSVFGLMMIAILLSGIISPVIAGVVSVEGSPTVWTFIVPGIACLSGLMTARKL